MKTNTVINSKQPKSGKKWTTQMIIFTGMLAALAGVLMSLEFSVPLMPPFYKVDFSDVPTVFGTMFLGPAAGACIEVIKILIKLITVGTNSNYVGEFSNLVGAAIFILPLWFVYKKRGANTRAMIEAMIISVILRTAFACFCNAFITLPLYAKSTGMPLDAIIEWVATVNPAIKDLKSFIMLATIPFNIIKLGLNYFVGGLLFVRLKETKVLPRLA
ncbi:MAG: ECF transporter S component [Eubacteriales bacterium]|nr:ECF transporter S component [Eubacteriales bacterium]